MKSRWIFTPAAGKIGRHRPTLAERIRKWRWRRSRKPDVFPIVNCYPAIYPTKK